MLDKGPMNTHLWRQTDCLSLTQNMADGSTLMEPAMHIQLAKNFESGKTAGELPILYWGVGQVWKITGESFLVYRLIYLCIILAGVYALFLSVSPFLKSYFWSVTLALSLYFAPVYLNYGISFLTDGPALAFAFIACYFLVDYLRNLKKRSFWYSMLFFSLVGLLKISSLIPFVFVLVLFGLELIGVQLNKERKLFQHNRMEFAGFFLVFLCLYGWYSYASHYNSLHEFKYTFNHIFPFWLTDQYNIHELLLNIRDLSQPVFMSKWFLLFLGGIWVFNITRSKKASRVMALMNVLIPIGGAIYVALWFPLFGVHDYYYMPLVIIIPAILIPFIMDLKQHFHRIYASNYTKFLVVLIGVWNLTYAHEIHALKAGKIRSSDNRIIGNPEFINIMNWTNWNVNTETYQFYRIRNYLLNIGVQETDRVVVLSDDSFNISLFLMGRKGWTNFMHYQSVDEINPLISEGGAKYLLIFEYDQEKFSFLEALSLSEIGRFEALIVYEFE